MTRTIIHADLDAFFASVEQHDRPELRGRPVVVGGAPQGRGVVAAASYEARRFGVHSAMPMGRALRLCPEAVRVDPRFERYTELSTMVMAIFRSVTPLVEPLSLDEAFLDVTQQVAAYGGAGSLARRIKERVRAETGLTVSIGVGTSKTVAKIASDAGKPDGLLVVAAGEEAAFLRPLKARALWGVGPRAEAMLEAQGIQTIGDLADRDPVELERRFGPKGLMLWEMAHGTDDRPVEVRHERKSVGAETTFARDIEDSEELRGELQRLSRQVAVRLERAGLRAKTVSIKIRYADFRTITRQTGRRESTDDAEEIRSIAEHLLTRTLRRGDRLRLLGVHCSNLTAGVEAQLRLWPASGQASR